MKQVEKLDLLLKVLYGESDKSGEVVSLLKNRGIEITLDEAYRLGKRLEGLGYIKYTPTKDSVYVELKSEGIEYVENDIWDDYMPTTNIDTILSKTETSEIKVNLEKSEVKKSKNVFVTYAWDDEHIEHQEYVFSFVNFLREKGFHADMDLSKNQEESALSFERMMHQGITNYSKIIIFLSAKYKQKAEQFVDGVGTEYQLIIQDIKANPKKYILVSMYGRGDDVVPLGFRGRDIINLDSPISQYEYNRLQAKLTDSSTHFFGDVADVRESVIVQHPEHLAVSTESILIKDFGVTFNASYGTYPSYYWFGVTIQGKIQNQGTVPIRDFTLEISLPSELCYDDSRGYDPDGYIEEDGYFVFTYHIDKLSPRQSYSSKPIEVTARHHDVISLFEKSIIVRVYTDTSTPEKVFEIGSVIYLVENGEKRCLNRWSFAPL